MFSQKKLSNYSKLVSQKIRNSKLNVNYFVDPYKHLVLDNFFEKLVNQEFVESKLDQTFTKPFQIFIKKSFLPVLISNIVKNGIFSQKKKNYINYFNNTFY